jgi:hypothetical protein
VAAQFQISVGSRKSGNKHMGKQMDDALKVNSNPLITYRLDNAAVIENGSGRARSRGGRR